VRHEDAGEVVKMQENNLLKCVSIDDVVDPSVLWDEVLRDTTPREEGEAFPPRPNFLDHQEGVMDGTRR
jgi:hypothetical protein